MVLYDLVFVNQRITNIDYFSILQMTIIILDICIDIDILVFIEIILTVGRICRRIGNITGVPWLVRLFARHRTYARPVNAPGE